MHPQPPPCTTTPHTPRSFAHHSHYAVDMWAVRYILMARAVWHGYNVW